jgi:pimeloyl-ACP methyl ester carboxylesterase
VVKQADDFSPAVNAWREGGAFVSVLGARLFVRDDAPAAGQPRRRTPIVFLHGYPTSSFDYRELFERLPHRRKLTFDFLGFGLSEKPVDHVYSLFDQADRVEELVRTQLGDEPFLLVAHDMGTSVTTELLARSLDTVPGRTRLPLKAVLLLNGSMVLDRASLTLSQKILRGPAGKLFAKLTFRGLFHRQFARIFSRNHPLTPAIADDAWALLAHDGGNRILDRLTFYLHERVRHQSRWHGALRDWPGRLELLWAMDDPVCTPAVLDAVLALRPHAKVTRLSALGHYPQLEDPDAIAEIVNRLAEDLDALA